MFFTFFAKQELKVGKASVIKIKHIEEFDIDMIVIL